MTVLSWIFMGLVWACILALNVFCFYQMFWKEQGTTRTDMKRETPDR